MSTLKGVLCATGAALAFSTLSIFGKLAPELGLNTITLLFWRFALAASVLVLLTAKLPLNRSLRLPALLLGLLYAAQATLYFLALSHLPAGTTSLILYLSPALVVGLQWTSGKTPTRAQLLALMAVLLGVTVLAGRMNLTSSGLLGWGLALSSAVCYALYLFLGPRLLKDAPPLAATAQSTLGTGLGLGLLGLGSGDLHVPDPSAWPLIAAVALVPTVLALPATLQASTLLGSDRASLLLTLEPVFVLLLASMVLGEPITLPHLIGGSLILLGAAASSRTSEASTTKLPAAR
ncbi:EamA family transporter [Deinococcus cellulosilyticus]|uniref:Membrane protein n=1 Tax=Deinococcus cellulosilyticus (strain DSM 18568 / NBRC 106333 / KACC 11606 / 5516J-15) TaxID=1223518 RepID=A0A511MYQ5_DEIC1|nr:DMT family transporter [Deinococcus cellulosilyticus]GEM45652.1 membrane protein [Deinococcus cellulosilyticus NBRC 106333 = KACC 11606]